MGTKTPGSLLRKWREKARAGVTLKSVADEIGVSSPALLDWEAGRRRPTLISALAVERVTGGAVPVASWGEELARKLAEMTGALKGAA